MVHYGYGGHFKTGDERAATRCHIKAELKQEWNPIHCSLIKASESQILSIVHGENQSGDRLL